MQYKMLVQHLLSRRVWGTRSFVFCFFVLSWLGCLVLSCLVLSCLVLSCLVCLVLVVSILALSYLVCLVCISSCPCLILSLSVCLCLVFFSFVNMDDKCHPVERYARELSVRLAKTKDQHPFKDKDKDKAIQNRYDGQQLTDTTRDRQTDRQRPTERQTKTNRETDRETERETKKQAETERKIDFQDQTRPDGQAFSNTLCLQRSIEEKWKTPLGIRYLFCLRLCFVFVFVVSSSSYLCFCLCPLFSQYSPEMRPYAIIH